MIVPIYAKVSKSNKKNPSVIYPQERLYFWIFFEDA
jgi:hypothetical protein